VPTPLQLLLRRVGTRCWFATFAARLRAALLAGAAGVLAGLLAARLLNLFPLDALPRAAWGILALPVIAALALSRRPSASQVARTIDEREDTKNLFLTTLLAPEKGGFASIVAAQAEERAATVDPARVVPFRWRRGFGEVLAAAAVVGIAFLGLPQLDPFNKQAARERSAEHERRLAEMARATEVRREEIAQTKDREPAEVKDALAHLEETFKQAKPTEKETVLKELAARQKEVGELWRRVNRPEMRAALEQTAQSFGETDPQRLEAWRQQLQKGDASALKKELHEIREAARALAGKPDSAEKRAGQQQLAQRLNELAQALKQMSGSPQVNEALQRALAQLDQAKLEQLSQSATEGALDSLQLGEEELDQLAQSLQDGKALEDALKSLQMAKLLADAGKLDGSESQGGGMAEYAALFQGKVDALGERGPLSREANLGAGPGNGALRPEDEFAKTGFKPEKSSAQLAGGKMLLEWKTKEVGESGARTEAYQSAVRSVQQGVAEAIQQEQVPPGYHETIKRYFDSLPAK